MILSSNGTVVVNPYEEGDTDNYLSAFKQDMPRTGDFKCLVAGDGGFESVSKTETPALETLLPAAPEVVSGTQLRTYRLAVAATNEYASAVGGNTVAGTLAAQVLIMNRVNGVYERDLAIHMNIVANNNLIIYAGDNMSCGGVACTAANDPYSNSSASSLLSQNQSTIDSVIGNAN